MFFSKSSVAHHSSIFSIWLLFYFRSGLTDAFEFIQNIHNKQPTNFSTVFHLSHDGFMYFPHSLSPQTPKSSVPPRFTLPKIELLSIAKPHRLTTLLPHPYVLLPLLSIASRSTVTPSVPTFSLPPDHLQSPGSATLEDVLNSLLDLPTETHRSSGMNL